MADLNSRVKGILLITRALTPLIVMILVIVNGLGLINDLNQVLSKPVIEINKSIVQIQSEAKLLQDQLLPVSNKLTSASQTIEETSLFLDTKLNDVIKNFPSKIEILRTSVPIPGFGEIKSILTNISQPLKTFFAVFKPVLSGIDDINQSVNQLTQDINGILSPGITIVQELKQTLDKWLQRMIIFICCLFLLFINYFALPLWRDLETGISLLFRNNKNTN
ncbi:MAG: hypothetical protein EAZ76_02610 [Nostocales cyanobacterium]|nr:MAG: hypothetical protein EAZ87_18605 [Nostocales cyanobacterium]TAF19873.1 MAG: hypothetical protein EAZ76_02610 [Nostocales cyanobacterium]